MLAGVHETGVQRAHVELGGLDLLAELLPQRPLHLRHLDAEELREDPVVDHVLDETPELGVGTDGADDLVERDRIEDQVRADLVQLQGLVNNTALPGSRDSTSSRAVSAFMATRKSTSFFRAM